MYINSIVWISIEFHIGGCRKNFWVIDSDSTKTHLQLKWLYLYCVQRHTGANNTGHTGAIQVIQVQQ